MTLIVLPTALCLPHRKLVRVSPFDWTGMIATLRLRHEFRARAAVLYCNDALHSGPSFLRSTTRACTCDHANNHFAGRAELGYY